jgi:hypothetical protein
VSVDIGKVHPMKRFLLASAAVALLAMQQPADAAGCLKGAALGAIAGHAAHHTFYGIFGGCIGGLIVHHMYVKWKKDHPDGMIKDFVADDGNKLPRGWADRLNTIGDVNLPAR